LLFLRKEEGGFYMSFQDSLLQKIEKREAKVAVIGLGYVGLPLAVEKAKAGFTVIGIDRKEERVAMVNRGENYIPDILGSDLATVVAEGKLRATQDFSVVADVDVITICVPTPLDKNKQPDTSYIEGVVKQSLPYLHKGQLVVLESTTYPGTTEEVILPRIESRGFKVGEDIFLAFSPERVDPGNDRYKTKNTPTIAIRRRTPPRWSVE
jgi:UDP-N-acetyl-D-glucosamine dehydrogenase